MFISLRKLGVFEEEVHAQVVAGMATLCTEVTPPKRSAMPSEPPNSHMHIWRKTILTYIYTRAQTCTFTYTHSYVNRHTIKGHEIMMPHYCHNGHPLHLLLPLHQLPLLFFLYIGMRTPPTPLHCNLYRLHLRTYTTAFKSRWHFYTL